MIPLTKMGSVLMVCLLGCISLWAGSMLAMPVFGWILWSTLFYPATMISRWIEPVGTPASLAYTAGFFQSCCMALIIWAIWFARVRSKQNRVRTSRVDADEI